MRYLFILFVLCLVGCDEDGKSPEEKMAIRDRIEKYNEPCHDFSVLLATTTGSPSTIECPNKLHKMRIQIASAPSKEEFGAVAFCECQDKINDAGK